jgi:pimeloyl-ACP methyl ester carboxylesterase
MTNDGGRVEPVLVVHGLFQGMASLRGRDIPGAGPVHVPDLLGYGANASTRSARTIEAQVEHVAAAIQRLGSGRAALVGHSVGGVIVMLVAARYPARVTRVVNVEGNFVPADAFWSARIAAMDSDQVEDLLGGFRRDVPGWLERQRIASSPEHLAWARRMFDAQPAETVLEMARSVVEVTGRPDYLETITGVVDSGLPIHLLAGERSVAGWGVPDFVRRRAASFAVQPGVGHMMPLEDPGGFLAFVGQALAQVVGFGAA